jgi:hypothetical protein
MRNAPLALSLLVVLLGGGCDDRALTPTDAGPRADGATTGGDAGAGDGSAPRPDGSTPDVDAGPPDPMCTPSAGSAVADAYCDLFRLALIDDGTGAVEARLRGRLMPNGLADSGCATVDSIEVQEGGVTVGTLTGIGTYPHSNQNALLARAPALPEMTARCGGDTDRFGGFGFIIHGRMDGGTFEARCADAEGGGRWPPALVVSCHENIDEPSFSTYASVDTFGPGLVYTTIDATMPHGPGGALTTVDDAVHVIAEAYAFGGGIVPDPFDITGFSGSTSEGSAPGPGPYSSLYLSIDADPFGTELCPVGWTGTGPEPDPSPVMLLRLTGTGERGAYSTEVYLDMCTRAPPAP